MLERVGSLASRNRVLGIAGYPATGKTVAAQEIVARLAGKAAFLPTNVCVLSGRERDRRGLSGCAPQSYDLPGYRALAQSLIAGETVVLPSYQWTTHDRTGPDRTLALPTNGLLILEGPAVSHPLVAALCDAVFFLVPESASAWLEAATLRDMAQRHYQRAESLAKNLAKAADMESLLAATRSEVTAFVSVRIDVSDCGVRYGYRLVARDAVEGTVRCLPN